MKTINELIRPNIRDMEPYSCARDEFQGEASVYLDANENPYNTGINRYPDPMQWKLKERVAELKGVATDSIFLGNGSDEAIDLLFRAFCEPGRDNAISITPSYGMYEVAAATNDVEFRKVQLEDGFALKADKMLAMADDRSKLLFICSPNNPSGNDMERKEIIRLLENFDGLVVVDEAYIDFSARTSFIAELGKYKNLVVLQTLSKAWGAAGIRLGMAFASPEIIAIYNKVKYPYNVNVLTQARALDVLNDVKGMQLKLQIILSERTHLQQELPLIHCVKRIYPTDANFILTEVTDANGIYRQLVEQGIIVRNRNSVVLCGGCLRITVGTPEDNTALLDALKKM